MEKTPLKHIRAYPPPPPPPPLSSSDNWVKYLIVVVIAIVAVVAIGGFILLSNNNAGGHSNNSITTPTPGIVLTPTSTPTPIPTQSSPYVSIVYSIVDWGYTYPISDNQAYLILNLTITNNGYVDGVPIYPYNPLSLGGFGLTMNSVSYSTTSVVTASNSSDILGMSFLSSTLQSVTLMNGGSTSGTIMFQVPSSQYQQPFTLQSSMTTASSYQTVNVKISGS